MAQIHHLPVVARAADRAAASLVWVPFETAAISIVLIAASGNWSVALVALAWPLMRARAYRI